jgi:Protein of unknown function (DUF2905)
MSGLGKMLIVIGLIITACGVALTFAVRIPWLGKLPGDIVIRKENVSFYFPMTTSILVSAIISILLWLFRR